MIRYLIAPALALALGCGAAHAQTYIDRNGTIVPAVATIPFAYIPLSPGQHNVAPVSATALTIPNGARYATLCASSATLRYTTDGTTTPTSTLGMPLAAGSCVALSGAAVLANFKAFSYSATFDVEYFQ